MLVIDPSTCGLMLAESRDLSDTTYSDDSVIGCELTGFTFTIIAGGGPCGPCGFPLHAVRVPAMASASSQARFGVGGNDELLRRPVMVISSTEDWFDFKRRIVLPKVIRLKDDFSLYPKTRKSNYSSHSPWKTGQSRSAQPIQQRL